MSAVRRQGSFHRPAPSPDSGKKGLVADFRSIGPLRDCERFSVMGYKYIRAPIISLLLACGPFAVLFGIAKIIVVSFDSKGAQAFAHIFKEVYIAIPSVANLDAPATVTAITCMFFVVASRFHIIPDAISSCLVHSMNNGPWVAAARASARCRIAGFKVRDFSLNFISAVTLTHPVDFLSAATSKLAFIANCHKFAESIIGNIGEIAHKRILAHIKE